MLTTIFTPTFNRAHTLPVLYRSLVEQTSRDFEWLVVDDGSTDGTPGLLAAMQNEGKIPMRVVRTPNGGKHRAINRGVREARGELFFIVDSDDYLTPDAVTQIEKHWAAVRDDPSVGGLCFRRVFYTTGRFIAGASPVGTGDYTPVEITYKLGLKGDRAEVFRIQVMLDHPFPEFEGEKFVPEALVWNRMSRKFKLRFIDLGIYMCEYLPDGLSMNFASNLKRNPVGFATYYREVLTCPGIPPGAKLKALARCVQCGVYGYMKKK